MVTKKSIQKSMKLLLYAMFGILFFTGVYSIPVIPNEDGFGMDTPAGRGGIIYKVTNLDSSGAGSLKECIDADGPRVCVFEVSGIIELSNHLKITNPYITIAGQTAPSPGITLKGAGIVIQASDVLLQHIRVRVGDLSSGPAYDDRDALKIESKYGNINNVVIDHVSASWATDEIFSTWSYDGKVAEGITVINSIFSEALYDSFHPDGKHSMGVLIGKNTRELLFNKNILAFNNYRNPLIRDDSTDVIVANNYIYNPGVGSKSKIYFGTTGPNNVGMRASVVGNVFKANPEEYYDNIVFVEQGSASSFKLYVDDNSGPLGTSDDWAAVMGRTDSSIRASSAPVSVSGLSFLKSSEVGNYVYANSGARPADRDDIDKRVVSNMKAGKGSIIDSQNDVGGWKSLSENYREFVVPSNPNGDDDKDGYTNLEELLHEYAYAVEKDMSSLPGTASVSSGNTGTSDSGSGTESSSSGADVTAPVILSASPSSDLNLGTTSVTLKVTTDETAYCHYDDEPNVHYLDMSYIFDNTISTTHTSVISGLVDGGSYTYYVRCKDLADPHNYNMEDYVISFDVNVDGSGSSSLSGPDVTAPVILSASPSSDLKLGTTSVTLKVTTDEVAYCHYDDEPNQHYLDMSWVFDKTYSKTHTSVISGLVDGGSYTYYVRCRDAVSSPNYNMKDYVVSFDVNVPVKESTKKSSSSGGGGGGGSSSKGKSSSSGGGSTSSFSPAVTVSDIGQDTKEIINTTVESVKNNVDIKEKVENVVAGEISKDVRENTIVREDSFSYIEYLFKYYFKSFVRSLLGFLF